MNYELLGKLVLQLLDDDYGISCDAYSTLQKLCEDVDPAIMDTISNCIRSADNRVYLKSSVDDNIEIPTSPSIQEKIDYFQSVKDTNKDTIQVSIWSIFDVMEFDKVVFSGTGMDLLYIRNFGKEVQIALPENPTWLDMWKAADFVIRESGDLHHIYIEQFRKLDDTTIELVTGS